MIELDKVKAKLEGLTAWEWCGFDRYDWYRIHPKIKRKLLRELWEVSLLDLWVFKRDIPQCDRCKEEILDIPKYILTFPLCDCCYDDFSCERSEDQGRRWGN